MIECLGSMVSALPTCSAAPGNVARENGEKESSLQTRNNGQVDSAFSNTRICELWVGFEDARFCCSPVSTYTPSRQPQGLPQQLYVPTAGGQVPRAGGCQPLPPLSPAARMLQELLCNSMTPTLNVCLWTSYKCLRTASWTPKAANCPVSCLEKMILFSFFFAFLFSLKVGYKTNLESKHHLYLKILTSLTLALSTTIGTVAEWEQGRVQDWGTDFALHHSQGFGDLQLL